MEDEFVFRNRHGRCLFKLLLRSGQLLQNLLHQVRISLFVQLVKTVLVGHVEHKFDKHVIPVQNALIPKFIEKKVQNQNSFPRHQFRIEVRDNLKGVRGKHNGVQFHLVEYLLDFDRLWVLNHFGKSGKNELVEKDSCKQILTH